MKKKIIFKLVLLLILALKIQTFSFTKVKRFYSIKYSIMINLPGNFKYKNVNGKISFTSKFAKINLFFYKHLNFLEAFNKAKTMGKGKLISQNNEVQFAHSRILRASRGGYLIFKYNNHELIHLTVLKKEYRVYIFKTKIKQKNLSKLKNFLSSIRLLIPDEKNYEATKNGKLYRLLLLADNSFRLTIMKNNKGNFLMGDYYYKKNELILKAKYKISGINAVDGNITKIMKTLILTKYKKDGYLKFNDITFKLSDTVY